MRIGIDVRMIFSFPTGIGNYRRSLMKALFELDKDSEYLLIGTEDQRSLFENETRNENVTFSSIKSKANHPVQHLRLSSELRKLSLDLFYTTHWGATLDMPCKYVLEIPDLIYHHYPEFGSWKSKIYERFLEKTIAKNAEHIVTISDFCRDDIVSFLNVEPDKVTNMKGAADAEYRVIDDYDFIQSTLDKYELYDKEFFVYLGNQRPHKNLVGLLRAFEQFRASVNKDVNLVIIGGVDARGRDADSKRIQDQLSTMKSGGDVILLGKVFDNNEVAAIFNRAIAMVHPSLHEGFGLTPLEAMKCGCPVICSNVTAMPEVVGDSGILINPENIKEISEAMSKIYLDMGLQNELAKKSLEQSKMFSWDKTATILFKVFNALK